jgi:hypothetical protein
MVDVEGRGWLICCWLMGMIVGEGGMVEGPNRERRGDVL